MKKMILRSILTMSALSVRAQTGDYQDLYFTNLYGAMIKSAPWELQNYHISNTSTGFNGNWGLDVKWWGGVKLKTSQGLLYLNSFGNLGINTEDPKYRLDVNGVARINNNAEYTFLALGKDSNDQLFADNSIQKSYGGGFFFRVHNETAPNKYIDAVVITENGDFGIGTNSPQVKLDVAGRSSFSDNMKVNAKIEAKEIKVTQSPTADFVFEEGYGLPKLEDVEKYIKEKKHLPEIASAKEMEKEGVDIGEFQIKLLQKIEELTLYSIEQNKKIKQLENRNQGLQDQVKKVTDLEMDLKEMKTLLENLKAPLK